MREYEVLEWTVLKGRGDIAVVFFDGTVKEWTPEALVGHDVVLEERAYRVRGVDMTRQMIGPAQPYRGYVGLLV